MTTKIAKKSRVACMAGLKLEGGQIGHFRRRWKRFDCSRLENCRQEKLLPGSTGFGICNRKYNKPCTARLIWGLRRGHSAYCASELAGSAMIRLTLSCLKIVGAPFWDK